MKTQCGRFLLSSLALFSAASLACASVPKMDVTVSDSAGKLLFKGKTDAQGLFTTDKLPAGDYVVQFKADSAKGGPFLLVVSAGKKKTSAESVPGSKFVKGGVAMRVEVAKPMSLSGQVAEAGQPGSTGTMAASKGNPRVKYVNGKKLVWVQGGVGSNIGGHWVDANSPEGQNVQHVGSEDLQDLQGRTQFPRGGNGGG